jgi:signal transduction histidine kinase
MIYVEAEEDAPPLTFDSDKVIQVLVNLLTNAVKFSPRGRAIRVIVTPLEDGARIVVRDRGPGIPEEFRSRVFDRFFRMEGGRQPGTGLGLAIAKEIATRHGGSIRVEDAPEEGCDFVFELAQSPDVDSSSTAPGRSRVFSR